MMLRPIPSEESLNCRGRPQPRLDGVAAAHRKLAHSGRR